MEGFFVNIYKRLKRYRRRKLCYQMLLINSSCRHHRKKRIVRATFGSNGRRRFRRIRIAPKLRIFHLGSPRKWLSRLREAYVKLMLGISKYSCRFSNCAGFPGSGSARVVNSVNDELGTVTSTRRCDDHDHDHYSVMKKKKKKEYYYEERVMAQIYSSLMAQGSLVPWCPAMIA